VNEAPPTTHQEKARSKVAGPTSYLEKLQFAERVVRSAKFRPDQRLAVRELCEATTELVAALLLREQGGATEASPGGKKPKA
jgi:hypothetical protein